MENTNNGFKNKFNTNIKSLMVNEYATQIDILESPCGSHKTLTIEKQIIKNKGIDILVCLTKDLANQEEEYLTARGKKVHNIQSKLDSKTTVVGELRKLMTDLKPDANCVILIQHATFLTIPSYIIGSAINRKNINVYVDEIPEYITPVELMIPCSIQHFKRMVAPKHIQRYPDLIEMCLNPKGETRVNTILDKPDDITTLHFKNILKDIKSGKGFIVDKQSWERLCAGGISKVKNSKDEVGKRNNTLFAMSTLNLDIFKGYKSVTIAGANAYQKVLVNELQRDEMFKVIESPLKANLKFSEYTHGERLTIHIATDNKLSIKLLDKEGNKALTTFINTAKNVFDPTKPVLAVMNKAHIEQCPKEWELLSVKSHGKNNYQAYTQLFYSCALNRKTPHLSIMKNMGYTQEQIDIDNIVDSAEQCLMRTGLRNLDGTEEIHLAGGIDKFVGEELAKRFVGCKVVYESTGITKTVAKQVKFNQKEFQANKRLKLIQETLLNNVESDDSSANAYSITMFEGINDNTTSMNGQHTCVEMVKLLKGMKTNNILKDDKTVKKQEGLFNLNKYVKFGTRCLNDFESTRAIILDIDKGTMSIDALKEVLKLNKIEVYTLYNSFSTGEKGKEHNCRCIIWLGESINKETYEVMYDYILDCFTKLGWYTAPQGLCQVAGNKTTPQPHLITEWFNDIKDSNKKGLTGIDLSKRNLASAFFLPCTVEGREDKAFFETVKTDTRYDNLKLMPSKILESVEFNEKKLEKEINTIQFETVVEKEVEVVSSSDKANPLKEELNTFIDVLNKVEDVNVNPMRYIAKHSNSFTHTFRTLLNELLDKNVIPDLLTLKTVLVEITI